MEPESNDTSHNIPKVLLNHSGGIHGRQEAFDLGTETLYQLISDKLLEIYTSKLCVLAIGFSSAILSQFVALGRKDARRKVVLIIADREEDQIVINDRMAILEASEQHTAIPQQTKLLFSKLKPPEQLAKEISESSMEEIALKKRKPPKKTSRAQSKDLEPQPDQDSSRQSISSSFFEETINTVHEVSMTEVHSNQVSNLTSTQNVPPTSRGIRSEDDLSNKPDQPKKIKRQLPKQKTDSGLNFVDFLSTNNTKQQRTKSYEKGGIFLTSSTKFCLDLVEQLIDPAKVDKIIVVNQYEVRECSPLALGINILHRYNPVC